MAQVVSIDLQPRSVTLRAGKAGTFEGSLTLTLNNVRAVSFPAGITIRPPAEDTKGEWISIPAARKRFDFPADKTDPIPITVTVPAAHAGKKFTFGVTVFEVGEHSDERYDSESADIVVPEATAPTVAPQPLPRWLIPVIVAAVLVLGGGGFGLFKALGGPKMGGDCDPAAPKCPDGIKCHAVKKQCLAIVGQDCKQDNHCVSDRCGEDNKCAFLPLGSACETTEDLCAETLACSPSAKKCLGKENTACAKAEECLSGKCADKKCAWLAQNDPCAAQPTFCGPGLACKDGKCTSTAPPPPDPPPPQPALEYDRDRPGNDYFSTNLPSARPDLCETLCKGDNRCRAFTYVKPGVQGPQPRCYLKSAIPRQTVDGCCVSGTMPRIRVNPALLFKESGATLYQILGTGGK